jgi:hypothetical protein
MLFIFRELLGDFVLYSSAKENYSVLACFEAFPGGKIRLLTERDISGSLLSRCFGDQSIPACNVFGNF